MQVSETWQDKVKAGFEHGLAMVQEKAQAGYEATRERVSTARAGQELLDKGGAAAEDAIRAKVMCKEAADRVRQVTSEAQAAQMALEETARLLRSAQSSSENLPEGITGVSDFQSIAEAYEAKAQLFKMMLETLEDDKELPTLPPLALPEVDAARLIQIKDGYKQTTLKVVEGAEIIRKNTIETGNIFTSQCMGQGVCM